MKYLTWPTPWEILDLSNNRLTHLPADFGRLHQLKILFLSNNRFEQIPKVIADCANLDTIGFKANRLSKHPGDRFSARHPLADSYR